ncbi:MAG: extracellular solute-binding protein [Clostridiales bacterium]|nr:extracellular solute-binding protein [Clostridiales bacterium]
MRKKSLMRLLSLSLCAFAATTAVACGGGGGGVVNGGNTSGSSTSTSTPTPDVGDSSSDVGGGDTGGDSTSSQKTQLRVYHYNAGYGQDWVYELKANFEKMMANVSFEENKMGVEVTITGDMNQRNAEAWRAEPYDVLFLEGPSEFYGMMEKGVVAPLDSIMTTPNPDDNNQTIEEKMTQQQRDAYNLNGHYYGIPHYAGHYGLIYNKDMFDQRNFYFAKDKSMGDFISDTNPEKTLGPDGKTGVIDGIDYSTDDGLPTTYEEFFYLCEEINANGIDPICWPGEYYHQHTMLFMDNLIANHEGAEQMNLNYSMEGTATDLIKLDAFGNIVFDAEGNPVIDDPLEITSANAYELARQEGRYYALKFMEQLMTNTDYFNETDSLEDVGRSHIEMQQMFLENGSLGYRENAMLMDGVWWQMEATATFNNMSAIDQKWSKDNRHFGWMPLPQATQEDADAIANGDRKSVFIDYLNAVACIKSNTPSEGVKNAALQFLKYAYTDEALANFTYTTGTTIGVEYLDAVDRAKLTPYERTLVDYLEKSEIVYQVSGNKFYASNIANLTPSKRYSILGYQGAAEAFYVDGITAEYYFTAHQAGYKGCAW